MEIIQFTDRHERFDRSFKQDQLAETDKTMTIENRPYGRGPRIGARTVKRISQRICWVIFSTVTQATGDNDGRWRAIRF